MLYEADLVVPANTLESAPAQLRVSMATGTIIMVEVQIPDGCRGLVFSRALWEGFPIWPTGPDQSVKGNDARIRWTADYDLVTEPLALLLQGWSPGTSFSHTITWRFNLASLGAKEEARESAGLLRRIGEAIFGGS